MTIKLGNLADWRVLGEGKSLLFNAPEYDLEKVRRIRIDLNGETEFVFYIKHGVEERFLALVPGGLQTLEFQTEGDFELMPYGNGHLHYWTSEAEEFWTEGDGETFSTIYERQERNPALEYIQFQAMQNQLRRDRAHAEELERLEARLGDIENGRKSGVHGGAPAQHQEPESVGQQAGTKGAKAVRPAKPKVAGPDSGAGKVKDDPGTSVGDNGEPESGDA